MQSHRPLSPDDLSVLSSDAASAETMKTIIKSKLREIMKTVDLDDITSKTIRVRLEAELNQKLDEFKAFIDAIMHLLFLGVTKSSKNLLDMSLKKLGSNYTLSKKCQKQYDYMTKCGLDWLKVIDLKSGWVSENYLAFERIVKWYYLSTLHERMIESKKKKQRSRSFTITFYRQSFCNVKLHHGGLYH